MENQKSGGIHKKVGVFKCGFRNAEYKIFEKKDFLGETFHVLKEKEMGQFGEYRTRRLA